MRKKKNVSNFGAVYDLNRELSKSATGLTRYFRSGKLITSRPLEELVVEILVSMEHEMITAPSMDRQIDGMESENGATKPEIFGR